MAGSVTATDVRVMEFRFAQAIGSDSGPMWVMLDLNGVTLIDRAGLDVLLDVRQRIVDGGGRMELVDPSTAVVAMLHEIAIEPDS
ncbi:STAS domain-containing protein [Nakamurella multipartita]|nr:STAS domain-containing protein [Nakamurella multipartita]